MNDAKLTEFDDRSRQNHHSLRTEDDCYYFIEYTRGKSFEYSDANSFINNLKKSPKTHGTSQWRHKQKAIRVAARTLLRELPDEWLSDSTFVPVPPSKAKDHPEYDDRLVQMLAKLNVDVRDVVYQSHTMPAAHESENRPSIDDLVENYEIDEHQTEPTPTHIVIVDDMITAGTHYRAVARVLRERFPDVPISGVFLARRIFADDGH